MSMVIDHCTTASLVADGLDEYMLVYDGRIAVVPEDATDASHLSLSSWGDVTVVAERGRSLR
jgi:hypothetical protein